MAITNGYVTLAQVIAEMGTSSITDKDARIEQAINSASRDIDNFAGRRFWQDPTVVAREYYADSWDELLSTPTAVSSNALLNDSPSPSLDSLISSRVTPGPDPAVTESLANGAHR